MGVLAFSRDGRTIASIPVTRDSQATTKHATPSTFVSVASGATPGDVIGLASGDYGTWLGASYSGWVTFVPEPGATVRIVLGFNTSGPGARSFIRFAGPSPMPQTAQGALSISGTIGKSTAGDPSNGTHHVELINCLTDGSQFVGYAGSDILIQGCTFQRYSKAGEEGRIQLKPATTRWTVRGNLIQDPAAGPFFASDGMQIAGSGHLFEENVLKHLHLVGTTHCDAIQHFGGLSDSILRRNYFKDVTNGFVSYDGNTHRLTLEDNIFDGRNDNPWSLVLLSDDHSTVRHNTIVGNPQRTGGVIRLGNNATKGLPASVGTEFYNNVAYGFGDNDDGATPVQHHNNWYGSPTQGAGNVSGRAVFAGGGSTDTLDFPEFATYDDARAYFQLASGAGRAAGVDGVDMGIR
jgi:hypothetical protein